MTNPLHSEAIHSAVQLTLIAVISYWCGVHFTKFFHGASAGTGGLWAAMSGIMVRQEVRGKTWASSWLHLPGTVVGAIVSAAILSWSPFRLVGVACAVFAAVLLCHVMRIPDHSEKAALTVVVVTVVSSIHAALHPVTNAALRFSEACLGAAVAALLIYVREKLDNRCESGNIKQIHDHPHSIRRPDRRSIGNLARIQTPSGATERKSQVGQDRPENGGKDF